MADLDRSSNEPSSFQISHPKPLSTSADKLVYTVAGVGIGFLVSWIVRGRMANFSNVLRGISSAASVGKHFVSTGTIPRTKLALVVRSDLEMTKGKTASQCGHAAVGAVQHFNGSSPKLLELWLNTGQAKVVLKIPSEKALEELMLLARAKKMGVFAVRDAGRSQVEPGTLTVVAFGPAECEVVDSVTGSLKLL